MTAEIPEKYWGQFCENLISQGEVVVDIRREVEGVMQLVAQHASITSASLDETSDACSNILTLELDSGSLFHITEPIRLILRKDHRDDRFHLLEIPAESGMTVLVFHPGINPAMLGNFILH